MNAQEPGTSTSATATTTGLVVFATRATPAAAHLPASSLASQMAAAAALSTPLAKPVKVNLNFCSEADVNETVRLITPKIDMSVYYIYVCPVVISVCFFSIIFNATLMSISRQSKLINKSPILLLSLNLAVTDLIASVLNGLNILLISYLPRVHNIPFSICNMLILELLRYSATLASALHLLALAFVHYRGTVNPLQYRSRIFYSQHLSRTINIISICCWLLPLTLMIVWFNSTPCQGFKPDKCDYLFLLGFTFRYMILLVFSVPLLLMSVIYVRIFLFISRHQKGFVFAASAAAKPGARTTPSTVTTADQLASAPTSGKIESEAGDKHQLAEGHTNYQGAVTGSFCPVCSLARAGDAPGDDDELVEVESMTILSEESNGSPTSEDELETGSSAQQQQQRAPPPAAVSLVHNDQDNSYTIQSKLAPGDTSANSISNSNKDSNNSNSDAARDCEPGKLECNDRAGPAAAASVTRIDYDPDSRMRERPGRPAAATTLSEDARDEPSGGAPTQAKLDCERQPPPSATARCQGRGRDADRGEMTSSSSPSSSSVVVRADCPLADHAKARTHQLTDDSSLGGASHQQTESLRRQRRSKQRRAPERSDNDEAEAEAEESEDATARPLLARGCTSEAGVASRQQHVSADAGDSLCEPARTWNMATGSVADLKRVHSSQTTSVKGARNSYTSSASRRCAPRPAADVTGTETAGQCQPRLRPSGGGSIIRNRPAEAVAAPKLAATLRCTCDNKLNYSTIKQLRRSITLATTSEAVDAATRRRTTPTATAAAAAAATEAAPTSSAANRIGIPETNNAKTSSGTSKLNLEPSISSRLSAFASAPASAGASPNSSFRPCGAGSGVGVATAANDDDGESEPDSSSASIGSCSSAANGKSCTAERSREPLKSRPGICLSASSVRARLLQLNAKVTTTTTKSSSLRVHSEAASLTVTTLTSGHPAHTNFSSASSSLNYKHHRHQSNSLNAHRHNHKHHHKHHRHDHLDEPQRLNSKKNAVPPTNTKALVTTLFILGTYIISYVPAILFNALTCIDSKICPFPLYVVPERVRLLFGTTTMLLLIAKSIVDPLIYSYRMNEIQQAISRYMSKRRSKSSSRATSMYNTTSQRLAANRGAGGQATQLTNFATSSFKLLTSTQASLRGPSSRAASIRVNQHQFDRPTTTGTQQQQQAPIAINASENCIAEEQEQGRGQSGPKIEPTESKLVHHVEVVGATGLSRISESIVSFSGDTGRNIANDKLEKLSMHIPKSLQPIGDEKSA